MPFSDSSFAKKIKIFIGCKKKVVTTIERVKSCICLDRALRAFRISKSTYYNLCLQIRFECNLSNIKLCFKKFPSQIANSEIGKIKKLCEEKLPLGWPLSSVWGYGRKKDILHLSLTSFINYVKVLKLDSLKKKFKKKRKLGFVTEVPNQVWHADITVFTLKDNTKAFIYLLIDNFSKFILNYKVSSCVSSSVCKDMVEEAFDKFGNNLQTLTMPDLFPLINLNLSKETNYIHLMTDGGPENQGELKEWIETNSDIAINKIIAKKDVTFSNSQIEALNKIIKYQFLYHQDIDNLQELNEKIKSWIPIYNSERPNRAGKYLLTPEEIYNGKKPNTFMLKEQMINNKRRRNRENQDINCEICLP